MHCFSFLYSEAAYIIIEYSMFGNEFLFFFFAITSNLGTVRAQHLTFPKVTCRLFADDWQHSFENVQVQNESG